MERDSTLRFPPVIHNIIVLYLSAPYRLVLHTHGARTLGTELGMYNTIMSLVKFSEDETGKNADITEMTTNHEYLIDIYFTAPAVGVYLSCQDLNTFKTKMEEMSTIIRGKGPIKVIRHEVCTREIRWDHILNQTIITFTTTNRMKHILA